MELKKLIENLNCKTTGNLDIEIENITTNSKNTTKNSMFICLVGENADGHNYAKDAEKNGATVIVCERKLENVFVTQIIVENTRKAYSQIFSNFYFNPQNWLKTIAITGTNGKTTTSFLIKSILEGAGKRVGLIGTQGVFFGNQFFETGLTTPDPEVLFKTLREMVDSGIEYVVMEASAHALELEKTEGIVFDVGVFTNFTQDHLDFFKTMENYKQAKLKLFNYGKIKSAVLNFDDGVGLEISEKINVPFVSYGIYNPSDIFAVEIERKTIKTEYVVNLLDNVFKVESNLFGEFNVYNSLAACGAMAILGFSENEIKRGLESLVSVPGRFNSFRLYNGATAVIDFAHTPDGLEQILKTLKQMPFNRIITVFGCAGNRDKGKRSQMGKIAEMFSDFVVITSDNPCYENPNLIIDDIEHGMKKTAHTSFVDRTSAVYHAIEISQKGDVIAILGKGAETYQDINGIKAPYNDFETVNRKNEELIVESVATRRKAWIII